MGANVSHSHFISYDFFHIEKQSRTEIFHIGLSSPDNITVSELRQNEDGSIISMKNKTNRIMLHLTEITFVFKANKLFLQQEKSLALLSQAKDQGSRILLLCKAAPYGKRAMGPNLLCQVFVQVHDEH